MRNSFWNAFLTWALIKRRNRKAAGIVRVGVRSEEGGGSSSYKAPIAVITTRNSSSFGERSACFLLLCNGVGEGGG